MTPGEISTAARLMINPTVASALAAAERLAPIPATREEATTQVWLRYYAALALAAHAEFERRALELADNPEPGSRPDLGHLIEIAVSSTAAAAALAAEPERIAELLWDLTPECGALNGEYLDWLAEIVACLGINPADLDPRFNAADWDVPSVAVPASPEESQ